MVFVFIVVMLCKPVYSTGGIAVRKMCYNRCGGWGVGQAKNFEVCVVYVDIYFVCYVV